MKSFLDEYYEIGYNSTMEKNAGAASEMAGTIINPLNILGGGPMAGLLGYGYGEKGESDKISDGFFSGTLANLLIPGLGPYRLGKRVRDTMDTNSEIKKERLLKMKRENKEV